MCFCILFTHSHFKVIDQLYFVPLQEEEVLQNDKEVQRLRQATKEFIDKDADEFNDFYAQFI